MKLRTFSLLLLAGGRTLLGEAEMVAITSEQRAYFEQKIRPVLVGHCYECHSSSASKLKGGLLLDSKAGWQKGGESGRPIIVPGDPAGSLLIRAIRHEAEDLAMPPKKPRLPAATIGDLVAWIKMGAPDPRGDAPMPAKRADPSWWSLQPLSNPQPPSPKSLPKNWSGNAIDRFIFAKLAEKQLKPSPPADARSLIRRMSYDVTGLPPSPEEVEAFARDHARNSQTAVEQLVDRLLASPHYGERWGRHWLDVVRFGESIGFERNVIIDDLWPFRDYVIRSFNEDKPFTRLVREHLAGDVIGRDDPAVEVGTAFLVAGPYDDVGNQDVAARANIRSATLDDLITATASAFLGLTIHCARCHHHKFDPVPMEDYYRLRAAFEGVEHGRRVVATAAERERFAAATRPLDERRAVLASERDALETEIDTRARAGLKQRTFPRARPGSEFTEERFPPIAARQVKFVMLADSGNPRGLSSPRLDEFEVWTAGATTRNVALATSGGRVDGNTARRADDFEGAYGVELVNDGRFGARWFAAAPHELTITLAAEERIDRVTFSHTRGSPVLKGLGEFPCEYEVRVSVDGRNWQTVAVSADREPWSLAHGVERIRRATLTGGEQQKLAALKRELAAVQQQINAVPPLRQIWAGTFSQPKEPTRLHQGGDPMRPGAPVPPASLEVLARVTQPYVLSADAPEGQRRLALAEWIASEHNPLTARVLANRVWHYHFGVGIVDTPGDFGFLGGLPTHPELLDWLAQRLIEQGWRLKPLHRDLLLSQTYLQSSTFRPEAARADGDSRWLWRFPPRRLAAEEVRDTLLAIAGKLDRRAGGPGFRLYKFSQDNVSTYFPLDDPGPETYRRAVYHQNARASIVDVLSDFDLPDTAFPTPRRASTTTPLQALTLLNHRFTSDLAAALSERLTRETPGGDPAAVTTRAFALAFQRAPSATERTAAVKLVQTHGLVAFCRALLNANELLHLE